ncbi:MAG: extracellular solute-binding protein [Eubacterium sp.]
MKRKIVMSVLLVMVLLIMILPGCQLVQNKNIKLNPNDPVSIKLWHYYNGPQKGSFDRLVAEFNNTLGAEKGIIVEPFSQGSIDELTKAVTDAVTKKVGADETPDIFSAYADTAYEIDQLGVVASLDSYLTKKEISEYIPSYIEEGRIDKEKNLKIFPIVKSTEILLLNKTDWDKFASATGADINQLSTIEGLTETAKAYYNWSGGKAFFGRDAMANYIIIGSKELGKEIFEVSGSNVNFNVDEKIMRQLWDNYYIPYINGYFSSNGRFASDDAKIGSIIALVGSTAGATYFPSRITISDSESYPIETLALKAPVFKDGIETIAQQGAGMAVLKSDERKEYAATIFLKWLTESDRNIDFAVTSGYLPVKKEANQKDKINGAIEKNQTTVISENLKKTLPVAIDRTNTAELYTSKAFAKGTSARNVLEVSMKQKAKTDLETINNLVKNGLSKDAAVAQFSTDENFKQWFESLKVNLEQSVK